MSLTKLTENLNTHQSLADDPSLTPEALKIKWDEAPNTIKDYINNTLISQIDTLISALQSADSSLSTRITNTNTALEEQGTNLQSQITTNAGTLTQAQLNKIYPVGAIYMSTVNTNPSSLFGGSWTQIKDRFLLASGDTYANGATGGTANHTHTNPNTGSYTGTTGNYSGTTGNWNGTTGSTALTVNQIPSHGHEMFSNIINGSSTGGGYNIPTLTKATTSITTTKNTGAGQGHTHTIPAHNHSIPSHNHSMTHSHTIGNTGSSSNMPPYLTVYMWKRTA